MGWSDRTEGEVNDNKDRCLGRSWPPCSLAVRNPDNHPTQKKVQVRVHWVKVFEKGKSVLIGDVLARVMPSSGYEEDASGKSTLTTVDPMPVTPNPPLFAPLEEPVGAVVAQEKFQNRQVGSVNWRELDCMFSERFNAAILWKNCSIRL